MNKNVLITGASGFIGTHLIRFLLQKNYNVIAVTRQAGKKSDHPALQWVQKFEDISIRQIDYVVNLAGANIGEKRWTESRKKQLIKSRVNTTRKLYVWLKQSQIFPEVIVSGSAIGYYGIDAQEKWAEVCTEQSSPQPIFMSQLCQEWELAALADPQQNTKIIRLGVVFGQGGGILPKMLLPIRLNLVGQIGHGRQPVVCVHIEDVLNAIEFIFQHPQSAQIHNVVAPENVTQKVFVEQAAKVLNKKPMLSAPSTVFRCLLGEQSQLILNGQYVKPAALQAEGFEFAYPQLKMALENILASG
ncbi:short chain dehydrogenase family protein [Acinetobacter baumannii 25442_1]|uniref:TIGR01777 family oxidoreductase n=1 Tax=Acinetobacter baumannii TaxID=470 RepID=UPI000461C05E|nr:TIGR01777 family oxidoreductase [Acinetobacter baumannii]KCW15861.1 short chain dehydrogenase family protein [Acinetobacter baumannii 25442_1]